MAVVNGTAEDRLPHRDDAQATPGDAAPDFGQDVDPVPIGDPDEDGGYGDEDDDEEDDEEEDDEEPLQCAAMGILPRATRPLSRLPTDSAG